MCENGLWERWEWSKKINRLNLSKADRAAGLAHNSLQADLYEKPTITILFYGIFEMKTILLYD